MKRKTLAALAVGLVVASSTAGWIAASQIRSPEEVAARTAPPAASPILVPVEDRVLSTDIVTRGTARFGAALQVTLPPSALKPNASLVTTLPMLGADVGEGDVMLTTSGRPVFLLEGANPAFRDMGPGVSGADVRQLEKALVRLGFNPGRVDGRFDRRTEGAVAAWYRDAGFAPMKATEAQVAIVRALEKDVGAARLDILSAGDRVATARADYVAAREAHKAAIASSDTSAAVTRARHEAEAANAVAAAEVASRQAALEDISNVVPATPADIAAAERDLANAQAALSSTRTSGEHAVAAAQRVVNQGPGAVAAAQAEATAANQAAAVDVANKQTALDLLTADPTSTPAQISAAQGDLSAAQAAQASTRLAGEGSVASVQRSYDPAGGDLASAQTDATAANQTAANEVAAKQAALDRLRAGTIASPADIRAARAAVDIAVATAASTRVAGESAIAAARVGGGASVRAAAASVSSAQTVLSNARAGLYVAQQRGRVVAGDLGTATRQAGVYVPSDEVVFVATAPVRVAETPVVVGAPAVGPLLTVTNSAVAIDSSLPLAEAPLVKEGMTVNVDEPQLGLATTGIVSRVATAPGTDKVDGFHVYLLVDVADAPPGLIGASVRLTIPIESSGGPVLAVPVSALSMTTDGTSRVQKSTAGALSFVTVTPGLSVKGYVGITPIDGSLAKGDMVVVGLEQAGPTSG